MKVNPEVKIREFSFPEDYAAVRSLWENAGPGIQLRQSDTPEEIYKKLMRDPDLFLVAELDGRMVGTVIGGFDGRRGLIYHLAVQASVREGGIGARLMDEVEKRMKGKGCIRSYLLVTKENEEAIRFYKKHGWSQMDSVLVFGKEI
jgi:ribosomal protein S18 acetylase RimI-like enzyme